MRFTVLIEFLIPGLATVLLLLLLLPDASVVLRLPDALPQGDTVVAVLLLVLAYPIGILSNFLMYIPLQRLILVPWCREWIVKRYEKAGIDLWHEARAARVWVFPADTTIRELFGIMRAVAFSKNIDRLNASHSFYEGLQRLARGVIVPLSMAFFVALNTNLASRGWILLILLVLAALALLLLGFSVHQQEEQIVRFFLVLSQSGPPQAGTPGHDISPVSGGGVSPSAEEQRDAAHPGSAAEASATSSIVQPPSS